MFFGDFCLGWDFLGGQGEFCFLDLGCYDVAGLGYGAWEAFCFARAQMQKKRRIQKLILLSPWLEPLASSNLARILALYAKSKFSSYLLQNPTTPHPHVWNLEALQELVVYGVSIEVYVGGKNEIMDADGVCELFSRVGVVYYLKDFGYLLQDFCFV